MDTGQCQLATKPKKPEFTINVPLVSSGDAERYLHYSNPLACDQGGRGGYDERDSVDTVAITVFGLYSAFIAINCGVLQNRIYQINNLYINYSVIKLVT